MTKKDFELIAGVIKKNYNLTFINYNLLNDITEKLAEKNPRFNKEKFLSACGVEVDKSYCECGNEKEEDMIYCKECEHSENCTCARCSSIS